MRGADGLRRDVEAAGGLREQAGAGDRQGMGSPLHQRTLGNPAELLRLGGPHLGDAVDGDHATPGARVATTKAIAM